MKDKLNNADLDNFVDANAWREYWGSLPVGSGVSFTGPNMRHSFHNGFLAGSKG